jgi:hypothetical protein
LFPGVRVSAAARHDGGLRAARLAGQAPGLHGTIAQLRGCLLCFVTVLAGVIAEADADAPLREVLAAALEANERLARLADELRAGNAQPREEPTRCRDTEFERVTAELAVLQRLVFGRSSERRGQMRRAGQ